MPICSYIAHPASGRKEEALKELNSIREVDAYGADKHDLLIFVTDTADDREEEMLQEKLRSLRNLECIALSYGHLEDLNETA